MVSIRTQFDHCVVSVYLVVSMPVYKSIFTWSDEIIVHRYQSSALVLYHRKNHTIANFWSRKKHTEQCITESIGKKLWFFLWITIFSIWCQLRMVHIDRSIAHLLDLLCLECSYYGIGDKNWTRIISSFSPTNTHTHTTTQPNCFLFTDSYKYENSRFEHDWRSARSESNE